MTVDLHLTRALKLISNAVDFPIIRRCPFVDARSIQADLLSYKTARTFFRWLALPHPAPSLFCSFILLVSWNARRLLECSFPELAYTHVTFRSRLAPVISWLALLRGTDTPPHGPTGYPLFQISSMEGARSTQPTRTDNT